MTTHPWYFHPCTWAGIQHSPQKNTPCSLSPLERGYHQIKRGTVVIQRDAQTRRYLVPDRPETLEAFGPLRAGSLRELRD